MCGIFLDIINFIIDLIVNIILLIVEIIILPFRLIGYLIYRCRRGTSGGYWSRPWGWRWRRKRYFGGTRRGVGGPIV